MAYYLVKDFNRGLDTRRMVETTEAGSLIRAKNCVITRGGEVERRKAWIKTADLPDGTFGLFCQDDLNGKIFHVWGTMEPPGGIPANTQYHKITHPDGANMVKVYCIRYFSQKYYVIAGFDNGDILNYFNGQLVTDELLEPIDPTDPDPPTEPPVDQHPVSGDRATVQTYFRKEADLVSQIKSVIAFRASGNVLGGSFNFVQYNCIDPAAPIDILATDTEVAVCEKIRDAINAYVPPDTAANPDFHCKVANRNQLIISFAEPGAEGNQFTLAISQSVTIGEFIPNNPTFINGVDPVDETFSDGRARIGGDYYSPGKYALQHKQKMYAVKGEAGQLNISKLNNPAQWGVDQDGADSIDFSMTGGRAVANLVSLATFQDKMAIFAPKAVHIWRMTADPIGNSEVAILHNTGTLAPKSVQEYGNTDVFYLDQSGVRSLQSRDVSGEAFSSDVGNPIDDLVREAIGDEANMFVNSSAAVDPVDGRYVIAIGSVMFCFNFFAKSKISAWTLWEVDFDVEEITANSYTMYARTRNEIYSYGVPLGDEGEQYDDAEVVVQIPYLHTGKPATFKDIHGLDVALINRWEVELGLDYSNVDLLEPIGILEGTTYRQQKIPTQAYGTHCSFRLTCTEPGFARIGNLAFHYRDGEEAG